MSRRISIFIIAPALIGCGLLLARQSPAAVKLSNAEIAGIIVGGPVTCNDDCSCPNCYDVPCLPGGSDPWLGRLCVDEDGWLFHEDCNCDGWGSTSPYCHILTLRNCYYWRWFRKNPLVPCDQDGRWTCNFYHGSPVGSRVDQKYDECTETSSNPHD
jgi:hypothetical protein